jgi:hypothetical protein
LLSPQKVAELRCEPTVESLEFNPVIHLTEPSRGAPNNRWRGP